MKRVTGPAATEALPGLDPACLAAKERLAEGKPPKQPVPRRQYGRTDEELSVIGFGGMVVKDVTPKEAASFVAEAVHRGVNYFDVAPFSHTATIGGASNSPRRSIMKRRDFLATLTATGALPALDPAYLAAKEKLAAGKPPEQPVPQRRYGRSDRQLSIIGFGGITVKDVTPEEAASFVAEAFDRGVNYFDVAPTYGNAQERLGPALKPYCQKCFLACKTTQRDAAGSAKELEESLKLLQTDHVDLYQLHALTEVAEVEKVFGPGGAMETFLKAKKDGKVRYIGFSAHSEEAAHAALDRYDFDSILFPLGFPTWIKAGFGPSVYKRASEAGKGILALKAMAHQNWPKGAKKGGRKWKKAWYEPFDDIDKIALALRFTLHLPVTAMIPPGHWELVKMALGLAQSGALTALNDNERKLIGEMAQKSDPIFPKHA